MSSQEINTLDQYSPRVTDPQQIGKQREAIEEFNRFLGTKAATYAKEDERVHRSSGLIDDPTNRHGTHDLRWDVKSWQTRLTLAGAQLAINQAVAIGMDRIDETDQKRITNFKEKAKEELNRSPVYASVILSLWGTYSKDKAEPIWRKGVKLVGTGAILLASCSPSSATVAPHPSEQKAVEATKAATVQATIASTRTVEPTARPAEAPKATPVEVKDGAGGSIEQMHLTDKQKQDMENQLVLWEPYVQRMKDDKLIYTEAKNGNPGYTMDVWKYAGDDERVLVTMSVPPIDKNKEVIRYTTRTGSLTRLETAEWSQDRDARGERQYIPVSVSGAESVTGLPHDSKAYITFDPNSGHMVYKDEKGKTLAQVGLALGRWELVAVLAPTPEPTAKPAPTEAPTAIAAPSIEQQVQAMPVIDAATQAGQEKIKTMSPELAAAAFFGGKINTKNIPKLMFGTNPNGMAFTEHDRWECNSEYHTICSRFAGINFGLDEDQNLLIGLATPKGERYVTKINPQTTLDVGYIRDAHPQTRLVDGSRDQYLENLKKGKGKQIYLEVYENLSFKDRVQKEKDKNPPRNYSILDLIDFSEVADKDKEVVKGAAEMQIALGQTDPQEIKKKALFYGYIIIYSAQFVQQLTDKGTGTLQLLSKGQDLSQVPAAEYLVPYLPE